MIIKNKYAGRIVASVTILDRSVDPGENNMVRQESQ
jgi:hypothetical protein